MTTPESVSILEAVVREGEEMGEWREGMVDHTSLFLLALVAMARAALEEWGKTSEWPDGKALTDWEIGFLVASDDMLRVLAAALSALSKHKEKLPPPSSGEEGAE